MKNPSDFFIESVKEAQLLNNDIINFIFESADKFMTWLIGFAITGFFIVVSNLAKFNETMSDKSVHWIIVCLILTVVSGLLFKYFYFLFQIQFKRNLTNLISSLNTKEMKTGDVAELEKHNSVEDLLFLLKNDFDEDLYEQLRNYEDLDEEQQEEILTSLRKRYKSNCEWAEKDLEYGVDLVRNTYEQTLNIKNKKFNSEMEKGVRHYKFKGYRNISVFFNLLSISLFISAMFIILFSIK